MSFPIEVDVRGWRATVIGAWVWREYELHDVEVGARGTGPEPTDEEWADAAREASIADAKERWAEARLED